MRIQKGFTLIEILIVVVILGILAAIVIPSLTMSEEELREARKPPEKAMEQYVELVLDVKQAQNNLADVKQLSDEEILRELLRIKREEKLAAADAALEETLGWFQEKGWELPRPPVLFDDETRFGGSRIPSEPGEDSEAEAQPEG